MPRSKGEKKLMEGVRRQLEREQQRGRRTRCFACGVLRETNTMRRLRAGWACVTCAAEIPDVREAL